MKKGIISVAIISIIISCGQNEVHTAETPRDTTITPVNAVTKLTLDSNAVENFVKQQQLSDSAASLMRNFYNSRNYQYAWFTEDGLAEQALAFWNLHNHYVNYSKDSSLYDKRLHNEMASLINNDTTINSSSPTILQTELLLTKHFFEYAKYAYAGRIDPKELQWNIPRKKVDAISLLDSLIARKGKDLEEWEPVNNQYRRLKKELLRYYGLEKQGGWDSISLGDKKNYKQGDSATQISTLKKRLHAVDDFPSNDTSRLFTIELRSAVERAQKRFGFTPNGIVDAALIKELNVPVEKRIEQLLINMERMRWLPKQPAGSRIIANIPEFKLHVFDSTKQVFDMKIVVGKEGTHTVVFTDNLKYIVFSPYWNVPRSIVRKEILPAMERNANYLSKHNMEITGYSNSLPVVRQKPGGSNSLGRVKFIFPNNYNIYFHDTPVKSLFEQDKRAFSHGCIRLNDAFKMAKYLLRNNPEWTDEKIREAMNAEKEKWVNLDKPVPVFISYFTAWVDADGLLNFRDDIYGHDKRMAAHLFPNEQ